MPIAPPANVPFSAAIDNPGKAAIAPDRRSQTSDTARPARACSRSAPALNTLPCPVKITARAVWACSMMSAKWLNMS